MRIVMKNVCFYGCYLSDTSLCRRYCNRQTLRSWNLRMLIMLKNTRILPLWMMTLVIIILTVSSTLYHKCSSHCPLLCVCLRTHLLPSKPLDSLAGHGGLYQVMLWKTLHTVSILWFAMKLIFFAGSLGFPFRHDLFRHETRGFMIVNYELNT